VAVVVQRSNPLAVISGGAARSVSVLDPFELDASASEDVDYPSASASYSGETRAVTFSWICVEQYPDYGADCGLSLPATSVVSFVAYDPSCVNCMMLPPAKTFGFSVHVSNDGGLSSSYPTVLSTTANAIPKVIVDAPLDKYNVESKILLGANIIGVLDVTATWMYGDSAVSPSFALTPASKQFLAGTVFFELALKNNIFTPGLSYTFDLYAYYPASDGEIPAPSQVTIVMNAAPVGGVLVVDPTQGVAMNTSFSFQTLDWSDDPNDYPLSYVISYYTTNPNQRTVVKNVGIQSYARNVLLGQGPSASNYSVTAFVSATDTYGGKGSTTTAITVGPVVDKSALASAMSSQMGSAFESGDVGVVSQVIGAVTASLNAASCTGAPSCSALNRKNCKSTTDTCSACLPGFVGTAGDANDRCVNPNDASLLKLGNSCQDDSDCVSGLCEETSAGGSKVCQAKLKTCLCGANGEECGGAADGTCQYVKSNGEVTSTCREGTATCSAQCVCTGTKKGVRICA